MLIVYDSRFGAGKSFAEKLGQPVQSVEDSVNEDIIFVTRNEGRGQISQAARTFLDKNKDFVKGVVVNGSMERHAETFCFAADEIAKEYGLTIAARIDGEGNDNDVAVVKEFIEKL